MLSGKMKCVQGILFIVLGLLASAKASGQIVRYVDDDAAPGGDGLAWATAYADLQDALDEARLPGSTITDIRIAGGRYSPDRGIGDLTLLYQMVEGVVLAGGYAGIGAPDPDERDVILHETILTTDRLNDDQYNFTPSYVDNSEQLLRADNLVGVLRLDGLTLDGWSSQLFNPMTFNATLFEITQCRFVQGARVRIINALSGSYASCTWG